MPLTFSGYTYLYGLLVTVVLDLIVDVARFPVHSVEGAQAAIFKVVKQVVLLGNARGALRPLRWDSTLSIV